MSLLCMPVLTPTGKVMAVMQALNLPGLPFTKEHEEYLSHMGAVVGTALHNSNFHRDVVNVQQHISVISSSLELDKILQIITNKTKELLRVKSAVVFLVDADARNLWFQDVMDGQILRRFANMQLYPAGKVALSGQTVCSPECGKDANINNKELKEHIGITARCLLAMPVKSPDGKIVGVIQAANKEEETGGAFSPEDEVLLRCIASHAGNALYNGQRFAEASASKKHSELFVGYMRALWSKRTIDEIMTTINAQSESLLNCDRCIVYIVDPKNAQSLYAKVTAEEDSREEKRLRNNGRGIVGMVVQSGAESLGGKSVHVADVTQSDAYDKETDQVGQLPPKAILAAPIVRRGTGGAKDVCIGCIELCIVENSKRVFIKEDGDRLELVASVAAVAFENCSLLEHSKEAVASLKHELDRNAGASALYQGIARQACALHCGTVRQLCVRLMIGPQRDWMGLLRTFAVPFSMCSNGLPRGLTSALACTVYMRAVLLSCGCALGFRRAVVQRCCFAAIAVPLDSVPFLAD
jgi:GAF domain-containing protein